MTIHASLLVKVVALVVGSSYLTSCKTPVKSSSSLADDENSNIKSSDFRELEDKAPHLSNGRIDVKHYDVSLTFPSMESGEVKADAKLTLKLLKSDRFVKLHTEKSTVAVKSAFILRSGKSTALKFKVLDGLAGDKGLSGSVLRLELPEEYPAGTEVTLGLNYVISKPSRGSTKGLMHRVDFKGEAMFATRNWPYYARYWLPSNDHPADTATFNFKLAVPPNAVGAANGALVKGDYKNGDGVARDGLRNFEWSLNTAIPVYGVSVVVGDLEVIQDTVCFDPKNRLSLKRVPCAQAPMKVPYVYYIQRRHPEKSTFLKQAEEGIKQMILMSSILGPYPYQKLGFASAPQDFNMESVSLMMMISPEATTHEVAHHWWGNTVYIEHWGDLWISEGLTSYFTGFYNEIARGKYEECSSTEGILNNPADTDPLKIFNDTPYCKGAAAIADLRLVIEQLARAAGSGQKGRDGFLQVMRDLYDAFKFKRLGSSTLVEFLRTKMQGSLKTQSITVPEAKIKEAVSSWEKKWLTKAKS
jgi:aminopeptidase N